MNNKNTIRRDYLIIRRIMRGDHPSASVLLQYLERNDITITLRTLQRDMADIRSNFDIEVIYDSKKNGYYIDETCSMDMDKLLYFLGLAESSDVILSNIKDRQRLLKYLSISPNPHAKGVENIGILLQAIQQCTVININHLSYQTREQKAYTVEPYLLKEFEGMWYLFAYCEDMKAFRTFGLDRIRQIQVTDRIFQRIAELEHTAEKFNNVYGLVYDPDNNPNRGSKIESLFCYDALYPILANTLLTKHKRRHNNTASDYESILRYCLHPHCETRLRKG